MNKKAEFDEYSLAITRTFIVKIRDEMQRLGITQATLANKLGCSQPNIATHLNGDHAMTVSTMMQLAQALDMTVQVLLVRTKSMTRPARLRERASGVRREGRLL